MKNEEILADSVSRYKKKQYDELARLATENYNDTLQISEYVQVGIDIIFDDKSEGTVRCMIGIYDSSSRTKGWWKLWQLIETPVLQDDFIMRKDGTFNKE